MLIFFLICAGLLVIALRFVLPPLTQKPETRSEHELRADNISVYRDQYQELEADWDAEGALPVSPDVSHLATWLVQMVALSAKHQKVAWQPPVVGPSADGGINLEWESAERQLLVMIRPGQPHLAECIIQEAGSPPRRRIVSVWDAIDQALWAISSG